MKFHVEWHDRHREPQSQPNPAFPKGTDVDLSGGRTPVCTVALPYPAKRCGHYIVLCDVCKLSALVTTAGRADDPRSVTVACKRSLQ